MNDLLRPLRVVLIGGTSHAGKSSTARQLAAVLGWEYRSTDALARHPGRPWRHDSVAVPSHVADHYGSLSVDDLLEDVLAHYERNVLPQVEALVRARSTEATGPGLVIEGSAIWPAFAARLSAEHAAAVWLTVGDELLVQRIHAESRHAQRTPPEQLLIDKFLQRTLAYAHRMDRIIEEHGLLKVGVSAEDTKEDVATRCFQAIAPRRAGDV